MPAAENALVNAEEWAKDELGDLEAAAQHWALRHPRQAAKLSRKINKKRKEIHNRSMV